ncbi:type II secretion system F family protein [Chloroflexota bacterium]
MAPTTINIFIIGGAVLLAGGLVIWGVFNALAYGNEFDDRIQRYAVVTESTVQRSTGPSRAGVKRFRLRVNNLLSVLVSQKLSMQLMSAHWPITEVEFVLVRIAGVVIAFGLGAILLQSPLSGVGIAIIAYILPGIYLRWSINRRRLNFNKQLVDALVLIEGGVRAGYSLLQALDLIITELPAPASEEFRRVKQEVGLGLPLSDALVNMTNRMQNKDLNLVVTAININTQVGGNLTTMISVVTDTIRERIRLFSEVRVLTAQQRYTGYLLTLLPFLVGGLLFVLNPEYMSRLFAPEIICIPVGALVAILLGNLVIRQMVKIDI